ncbi:MAG: PAS-domain containing protein [Sneathiella sp.]
MHDEENRNEERLQHFLKMQKDLFLETDQDLKIVYVHHNEHFGSEDMLGRDLSGLLSQCSSSLYDWAQFETLLASRSDAEGLLLAFKNGSLNFPVKVQFTPIFNRKNFTGFRLVIGDASQVETLKRDLSISENRFQVLFDNVPSYVSITDVESSEYLDVNSPLSELHNKNKEEFIGTKSLAITQWKNPAILAEKIDALLKQELVEPTEVEIVAANGAARLYRSLLALLPGKKGPELLVISTDITGELAEKELEEKNESLNAILEAMFQGVTMINENLELIFCNSRFLEQLDFPKELGKPGTHFSEFMRYNAKRGEYGPGDVEELVQERVDLAQKFMPHKFDRIRADGTVMEIEGHYVPKIGFISTYTDITDRVKAEEATRENEKLLREIVESLPFGFSLWSEDLRLILTNYQVESWYPSMESSSDVGTKFEDYVRAGIVAGNVDPIPENIDAYIAERVERLQNPPENMLELLFYGDRWLHVINKILPSGRIACIRIDVTEQKLHEDQLRQAQKMEAVGQLTGGIAHDFNNLLAVILGNAELLGEVPEITTTANTNHIDSIVRAAGRGAELTQQLLSFSRKFNLNPKPLNLNRNIEQMAALLERSIGDGVEIVIEKQKGLWTCMADPGQIENSLLNLCLNAKDAMGVGGQIKISTENVILDTVTFDFEKNSVSGKFVKFSVSDNGHGISTSQMKQIFEPFFTTKDVGKGSGLGLSMVFGFVKQSRGYIAVESTIGKGATFCVFLPKYVEPDKD